MIRKYRDGVSVCMVICPEHGKEEACTLFGEKDGQKWVAVGCQLCFMHLPIINKERQKIYYDQSISK